MGDVGVENFHVLHIRTGLDRGVTMRRMECCSPVQGSVNRVLDDDVSRAPTVVTPSPASLLPPAPHATPRLSIPCSRAPSRWHRQPGRTPPFAKQRRGLARRTEEGYATSSATATPLRRRRCDSPGSPAPGSGSAGSAASGKRYPSPTRQMTRQWTPPQPQVRWRCPGFVEFSWSV
jgi:hypothetical protein